jgi:uncharacterized lipoprotein YajG
MKFSALLIGIVVLIISLAMLSGCFTDDSVQETTEEPTDASVEVLDDAEALSDEEALVELDNVVLEVEDIDVGELY